MDKCVFMGRLASEVEVRTTQAGKSVASFRLAVNTGYKDNKKANFFSIVAFDKTAELIAAYFHKGDMICLETEAQQNNWTDKEGKKREDVSFIVRSWEFCGNKQETPPSEAGPQADENPFISLVQEELPFM